MEQIPSFYFRSNVSEHSLVSDQQQGSTYRLHLAVSHLLVLLESVKLINKKRR